MNVRVMDDPNPELMEYFTVVLENPPQGTALIDTQAVSCPSPIPIPAWLVDL